MSELEYNPVHFKEAVEYAASCLIKKGDAIEKFENYKKALEYTMGSAYGQSIHPQIGEFWAFKCRRGFEITLTGDDLREVKVPVKYFLNTAKKVWEKEKFKVEQVSLF